MLKRNRMTAFGKAGMRPLHPVGGASHCITLSSHIVNDALSWRILFSQTNW